MVRSLALLGLLGLARVAAAVPVQPDPEGEARAHFVLGQAYCQHGQYELAIAEFRAAYAHMPVATLLFDTAQAYRALGRSREAVAYFTAYLRAAPDGRVRSYAEARINELGGTPGPSPVVPPAVALAAPAEPGSRHPGRRLRIAGIVGAVAGAAMVATGVYFSLEAVDASDQALTLSAHGGAGSPAYARAQGQGRQAQRVAAVMYVGGGASVLLGGILYYLGLRDDQRAPVAITTSHKGVHLAWSGHF